MSRKHALDIFRAALEAADPEQAVLAHLTCDAKTLRVGERRYRLSDFDRIYVVGAGKASARMAHALERLLMGRQHAGRDEQRRRNDGAVRSGALRCRP